MAKKNEAFFFDSFAAAAELACKASQKLDETMRHFNPAKIEEAVAEMHEIEQEADEIVHAVNDALITAFITPIEREDIATLSNSIDVVIDRIEGVLHRLYFTNIQEIHPDALEMSAKVMRATEQMHDLVLELPQFKRSKSLREHVITVNTIESECDDLYIAAMRKLHTSDYDSLTIISWRDVYTFLEFCADSCEFVADTVESIVMKNS